MPVLDAKDTISLLGVIVALGVSIKGIAEYRKAYRWKKAEFLAQEVKSFRQDADVKKVLLLLDWTNMPIQFPENGTSEKREVICTDDLLCSSLIPSDDVEFNDDETAVRLLFDQYLDKLGMFERYIQAKLITIDDIRPYLQYWIDAMCKSNKNGGRKEQKVIEQLWGFIDKYKFGSVRTLCEEFGHRMPVWKESASAIPHD